MIFLYLVNRKNDNQAKIWHFQCSESTLEAVNQLNLPDSSEYQISRTTFIKIFYNSIHLLSKNVPNFSWLFAKYQNFH